MNVFERADTHFVTQAADDLGRQAAIQHHSTVRNRLFWVAMLATVLFLARLFSESASNFIAPISLGFWAAVQWILVMRHESDLRLLKLVEKLKR